jgi:hypothetical protein
MRPAIGAAVWTRVVILLMFVAAISSPAWSQSCALCYTQAYSAGARMVQALRSGILVLIFPPMGICIGLTILSYRKRDRFNEIGASKTQSDLGW